MAFDTLLFYSFLLAFIRISAMMLAAPVFSGLGIPPTVRIGLSAVIAAALAPMLQTTIGPPPDNLALFVMAIAREAAIGLLIGYLATAILSAAEMAGSFIDIQIGFSMMSVLNPTGGSHATVLAAFKARLALMLFLVLNGHHLLIDAVTKSYALTPAFSTGSLQALSSAMFGLVGQVFILAVQIAAPAAATLIVAEMAMGVVSRAVPQMNILLVGAPAKVIVGLTAIAVGLPAIAWSISFSLSLLRTQMEGLFKLL